MAKKSKTFELFGKFRYFKGFPKTKDNNGPEGADWGEHGGMYLTDFIMDEENADKARANDLPLTIKDKHYRNKNGKKPFEDVLAEDEFLISPRRKHEDKYPQYGGPPVVVDGDGNPIDPDGEWSVGNDSEGYIQITVYQSGGFTGHRWEGAQVTDWKLYPMPTGEGGVTFEKRGTKVTEYVPEDDEDEVPAKPKAPKAKSKKKVEDLEDGDIPL